MLRLSLTAPQCYCQKQIPEHAPSRVAVAIETLKDRAAVLVAKIGPGPRAALEGRGIQVFETPGFIEDALREVGPKILA